MFNLAIGSKLRNCDPVTLRVSDVAVLPKIPNRVVVIRHKTGRPVRFGITHQTRDSLRDWFATRNLRSKVYVFRSRNRPGAHLPTRQHGRTLKQWVAGIGLVPADYGTHYDAPDESSADPQGGGKSTDRADSFLNPPKNDSGERVIPGNFYDGSCSV